MLFSFCLLFDAYVRLVAVELNLFEEVRLAKIVAFPQLLVYDSSIAHRFSTENTCRHKSKSKLCQISAKGVYL